MSASMWALAGIAFLFGWVVVGPILYAGTAAVVRLLNRAGRDGAA